MKLVFICSPYRGDIPRNVNKAKGYCRYAYSKGAVPFAPHLNNTQFLDDGIIEERKAGIVLGLQVLQKCDELWCFGNRLTEGMEAELKAAQQMNLRIRFFTDKCEENYLSNK